MVEFPTFRTTNWMFFVHVSLPGRRLRNVEAFDGFLRLPTRHRQKCIVSGFSTGALERWSICKQKERQTLANTDGCSHFSKGSLLRVPPALTEEEWAVPTSSPFQKGLQDSRKLRCCSIQLDFVAKGCTANLLNTKPKPMILIAFLSTFQSVPASRVIPSRELTCSISRYRLEEWHFPLPFWWDMWSFDPRGRASPPPLSDQTKKRVKRDRWPDPQGRSKCPPTGTRRYELYPSPIASPQKSIVCETCTDPWWLTAYCKPWPGFRWTKKVFI